MLIDHNKTLFSSVRISIGLFDCPLNAPNFSNTGPISHYLLAFPRTAVKIRHLDRPKDIMADPNIVTIYNKGQEYERYPISDYGDRCDWLAVCPTIIAEILTELGIQIDGDPERLFQVTHCASSAKAYALFRRLISYLAYIDKPNAIAVEETALSIFRHTLIEAYTQTGSTSSSAPRPVNLKHIKLVHKTLELLTSAYAEPLSLQGLAAQVNTSVYHLCRIFRRVTGCAIHQYLTQLRLRNSLQQVAESNTDFSTLGITLGFSDHSHFSYNFRKAFGVTPSNYRRTAVARDPFSVDL